MSDDNQQEQHVSRVIDFRVPLLWLLGVMSAVGWGLVSMWFMVNQLTRDVSDLQITVKAGNGQAVTVAGELALLRYRVENIEADRRVEGKGK